MLKNYDESGGLASGDDTSGDEPLAATVETRIWVRWRQTEVDPGPELD
jgi:hypothetical protein